MSEGVAWLHSSHDSVPPGYQERPDTSEGDDAAEHQDDFVRFVLNERQAEFLWRFLDEAIASRPPLLRSESKEVAEETLRQLSACIRKAIAGD